MKRVISTLLWLLVLFLVGCSSLYPDEYVMVTEHVAPYAYKHTEPESTAKSDAYDPMPTASRANEIREIIQNMVKEGKETEQILLVDYVGDINEDLKNMVNSMREDSPKYVYAMHSDSFESDVRKTGTGAIVTVGLKLRLTAQEVQAIETELFPEPAMTRLCEALNQHLSSYTVQVSGYRDTNFLKVLDDYILHNPDQVVEAPGISVAVYPPDRGNVRVLDFHFDYSDNTPETLKTQQSDTRSLLNASLNLLSGVQSAQKTVDTLYKLLVPPYGYKTVPEATVYSLVVAKDGGSSRIMASVVEYLCRKAGWNCEIVVGMYNGKPWYFNRILEGNQWFYFDLHAAGLSGEPPVLRTAEQMQFYTWDLLQYPEVTSGPVGQTSIPGSDPSAEPTEAAPELPPEETRQEETKESEHPEPPETEERSNPEESSNQSLATEAAETESGEAEGILP